MNPFEFLWILASKPKVSIHDLIALQPCQNCKQPKEKHVNIETNNHTEWSEDFCPVRSLDEDFLRQYSFNSGDRSVVYAPMDNLELLRFAKEGEIGV